MSDFLLLKDKNHCPKCFTRRSMSGNCHNCGVRLFMDDSTTDFRLFEEGTGIVNWWAFNRLDGWKHRDHYMIAEARPLVKRYEIDVPDANYGKQTTPEKVAATIPRTKRFRGKHG